MHREASPQAIRSSSEINPGYGGGSHYEYVTFTIERRRYTWEIYMVE